MYNIRDSLVVTLPTASQRLQTYLWESRRDPEFSCTFART